MENSFRMRLAGQVIEAVCVNAQMKRYCADYLCTDEPAVRIETTQADIEFEREKSAREDEYEGIPVRQFSDAYLETLALYRKIAVNMLDHDTILFHGSVISVDGEAYLFTAKSGTGKSTHTRLWREIFGERAVMVNDDKPLLQISESGIVAYGTPWRGKHGLGSNMAAPLKAICILERAKENTIRQIGFGEAYSILLQQCYRPQDAAALMKTLKLVDKLGNNVSLFRLGCNMDREAAIVAYNGMKGVN